MKKRSTIYWIEQLTLLEIMAFLALGMVKIIRVRYDEHRVGKWARRFLAIVSRFGKKDPIFLPAGLFIGKTDAHGKSLMYRVTRILARAGDGFCHEFLNGRDVGFRNMVKSYIADLLRYRVIFMTMVLFDENFDQGQENIILLEHHPINQVLFRYINPSPARFQHGMLSFRSIKYLFKPIALSFLFPTTKLLPVRPIFNTDGSRPAIWIEQAPEPIPVRHDFFVDLLNPKEVDIVYYFDRSDIHLNSRMISKKEKAGYRYIDLHMRSFLKLSEISVKESFSNLLKFVFCKHGGPFWFLVLLVEYGLYEKAFAKIYTRFQVKILLQHQESSWQTEAQKRALEKAGGILIGIHWSGYPTYQNPWYLTPQHVFFVWGKVHQENLIKKGETCNYILPCGLWIKGRQVDNDRIRLDCHLKYRICIFDSGAYYTSFRTPDAFSQFYLQLIDFIEKNDSFGGIVKSKKWEIEGFRKFPQGAEIVDRMQRLVTRKKLQILPRETSPVDAAAMADISVSLGINTAGMIAGVLGKPTLQWDTNGVIYHPIYRDPLQKILYSKMEQICDALICFAEGDKSVGDFSRWKEKYSHYNDLNADSRIANFIQDFVDYSQNGGHKVALEQAAENYVDRNSVNEEFSTFQHLWIDES